MGSKRYVGLSCSCSVVRKYFILIGMCNDLIDVADGDAFNVSFVMTAAGREYSD